MLPMFTIFDTKALAYNTPFFAPTRGSAIRSCADLVSDMNTMVARHPADYVLYEIGTYDPANGIVTPHAIKEHIIDLVALVPAQVGDLFKGEK